MKPRFQAGERSRIKPPYFVPAALVGQHQIREMGINVEYRRHLAATAIARSFGVKTGIDRFQGISIPACTETFAANRVF